MTFTLLGNLIEGTSDIIHGGITKAHRITDDTLDHTGLSAFIPPALHEVSDATFGLVQRGILDVGHTSGSVLRSFDQRPLHAHDKEIGGNLRDATKRKKAKADKPAKNSPQSAPKVKLCKVCGKRPRVGDFKYCSTKCAQELEWE